MEQAGIDGGVFDVVVIGAGMAGLSAAAFLGDAGRRVLVVDSLDRPGGLLAELPLPGFHMSAGVHNLAGAFPDGPAGQGTLAAVTEHLELNGFELLPLDTTYEIRYPEATYRIPVGREAWIEMFARQHPAQENALSDLLDVCERMARELARLPISPDAASLARLPVEAPLLLAYSTVNTLDVLGHRLDDQRLVRAVSSLCEPYLALPPARAPFAVWAMMTNSYLTGTYQCRGGFQRFADSFAAAVRDRGGTLSLGSTVTEIRTQDGQVSGVAGRDWQVSAPVVVAAMDARQLLRMLAADVLPRSYRHRLESTEVSSPLLSVYLATDLPIDPEATAYEAFHVGTESLTLERGDFLGIHVPTLNDPSQAPPGQHLVELICAVGHDAEDPFAQAAGMITRADASLPGLADHLVPLDPHAPTPYAIRRFSAPYGWACTPRRVGLGGRLRLGHATPIGHLYLAGQWTQPAHGIPQVVASGAEVARLITNDRPHHPLLPLA